MNLISTRRSTAMLLALALPAALLAQGSSDRIQRLRERLLERGKGRDEAVVASPETPEVDPDAMVLSDSPAPVSPATPPALPSAGTLKMPEPEVAASEEPLEPEAITPGQEVASDDLDEEARSSMKNAAARVVDDSKMLAEGGFKVVGGDEAVDLAYPEIDGESEYILEVQSQLKIPGSKVPVPHRRLLVVKSSRVKRPDGRLGWTFHVKQARESKVVSEGGQTKLVLVSDEDLEGAVIPLDTDLNGVPSRTDQTFTQARFIEWLRLLFPNRPKRPGYGWRTLSPRSLGSRREAMGGIYLFHRLVELGNSKRIAVIRGRFQGKGAQMGESKFMSMGQDRVLFDLDQGRVLYREFRMEGSYLRNTPQGPQPYQARIKGLVMERSLLEGLSVEGRTARLNAATALFGQ